ncbi:hypothetical protein LCGC14_1756510 [marine sediment metagenome]|uniref:Uncharacterized protein n=1 Tax=marine sediment metagenome TaxID=412755 RepID=A0A0F9K1X9_9ZZZZ
MNTIYILGILTLAEIIFTREDFNGITIILWVLYGIYKLFTIP